MFENNKIFNFLIFLLVLGLLISDPFLQKYFPGVSQGLLTLPFLVVSFYDYIFFKNNVFVKFTIFYGGFILALFIFSGGKSFPLFSNTFGTALLGLSIYNYKFTEKIFNKSILFITIGISIIGICYYLNLWEINEQTRRSTFIDHNQNMLSHYISFGVSCLLYFYFTTENVNKKYLLYLVVLLIIPILSTVSRTGIVLLFFTIAINIYYVTNRKLLFFISTLVILFSSSALITILSEKIPYIQQFIDRSAEADTDDRITLWASGGKLAAENLFTGVGFNNFYNEDWRISVGLTMTKYDEYTGNVFYGSSSVHNSFLDLILIGGIFLLLPYVAIIIYLLYKSFLIIKKNSVISKAEGCFVLGTTIGIILFSYTGQAATYKFTWFIFAINYYLVYKNENLVLSNRI